MTLQQKGSLTKQALRLFTLGLEVERRREKLRRLVERGVSYRAPEMREALRRFQNVEREWKKLEQEHLALRSHLTEGRFTV